MQVALRVNGEPYEGEVPERLSLADLLRDRVGLTGTHLGCEHGICGACTVQVDGEPIRSCLMFAVQADGAEVRTVESLAGDGDLHPLQQAFHEHHALQCGFCTPGFLMSIEPLLPDVPGVDDATLRGLLSGNLCRCTGYQGIVEATRATANEGVRTHQAAASVPAPGAAAAALAEPSRLAAALRTRAPGWELWLRPLDVDERSATAHLEADAHRLSGPERVRAGIELALEDGQLHARVSARAFAVAFEQKDLDRQLAQLLHDLVRDIAPPSSAPPDPDLGDPRANAHAPRGRQIGPAPGALRAVGGAAALGVVAAVLVRRRRR